jgi:multimeric flavodoxin WrbA
MIKVDIRILGISGSPIEGGNCDVMVQEALKTAAEIPGVETEFITLANKQITMQDTG